MREKPDNGVKTNILPQRNRSRKLHTQLLLLVVACIVPLFIFGFGNAYFDYQAGRAEASRQALNMTRALAVLVQRDLEARLAMLQVLAMAQSLQTDDIAAFRARAEAVLAQQQPGADILLLLENGQQVMNTALPPEAPLPARQDTTGLQQLFATAKPHVSDVFINVVTNQPVIALEVPVLNRDGRVKYSLALNPTVAAFAEIVHRERLREDSIVSILDRQAVIIARTPHDARFVGKKAGPILTARLASETEGIIEANSADGIPVIAAFTHVPEIGWGIAIGLPRAKVVDAARQVAIGTFVIGGICLVIGLAIAHAIAKRIARPIASLQALSVTLDNNEPPVTIATGLAETDQVARALIAAARKRQTAETAGREAEQERAQAAQLLHTVIETAPSVIYAKDRSGRIILANTAFLNAAGKTAAQVLGRTDAEFRDDPKQAELVIATERQVLATGQTGASEEYLGTDGNQPRVWLSTKTPLRDANQQVIGLVGVSVEITDLKQVEDRLRQMVNELNHRVKNTLATVQSIAVHTLRGTDRAIRQNLEARLIALASAHDILTRESWQGANLTDIVAGALAPYGGIDDARFHVTGPPLRLQPRAAVALAMGLHELATNALKFGALTTDGGRVEISWAVTQTGAPGLRITWSEQAGPPVSPPARRGFGTTLIERSLAQDLRGEARIRFVSTGVTCVIDAPLADAVATAAMTAFPRIGSIEESSQWS